MARLRLRFTFAVVVMIGYLAVSAPTASARLTSHTVDFTTHGQGPFDPYYYSAEDIVFTAYDGAGFVGFVQFDEALIGAPEIAASFTVPIRQLAVSVANGYQQTGVYVLTAYHRKKPVASKTFTLNQELSSPGFMGWGYFTIDLGRLRQPATRFTLDRTVISGDPQNEYGANTITYSTLH